MPEQSELDYGALRAQLSALLDGESDALANAANFVAFCFAALHDVNWLGIYVLRGPELVLGPFQGKPACARIPIGRGVCGAAASRMEVLRVSDVHKFRGHIVCDPASRSEIVIPLIDNGCLLGVLDVDSPKVGRFDEHDENGLLALCEVFVKSVGNRARSEFI